MITMEALKNELLQYLSGGVALAFSGGVDSALLLAAFSSMRQEREFSFKAYTIHSKFHVGRELREVEQLCREFEVELEVITANPMIDPKVRNNDFERCYFCKKALFTLMIERGRQYGIKNFVDGTNSDDLNLYRPGRRALKELGIRSPLADVGINKDNVRSLAARLNLSVATKPAAACLATRFEYNTCLSDELLDMVRQGEEILHSFLPENSQLRLRFHNGIGRIEVKPELFSILTEQYKEISRQLKKVGFDYVTLDLEGFRSGSMDIKIENN